MKARIFDSAKNKSQYTLHLQKILSKRDACLLEIEEQIYLNELMDIVDFHLDDFWIDKVIGTETLRHDFLHVLIHQLALRLHCHQTTLPGFRETPYDSEKKTYLNCSQWSQIQTRVYSSGNKNWNPWKDIFIQMNI